MSADVVYQRPKMFLMIKFGARSDLYLLGRIN